MIYNNVLDAVGNTPLIRLNHMTDEGSAEILVKYEAVNIGGSIKTRTAYNMILDAEKKGLITKDTIIVEPTSGNQGIGLALVGAVRGYKTIIIMPDSVSEERRKLVQHYGAEVLVVHDDNDIGKCIKECIALAQKMKDENPNVFVPQQFEIWPIHRFSSRPPDRKSWPRQTDQSTDFVQVSEPAEPSPALEKP